jgi:hypothetical protein
MIIKNYQICLLEQNRGRNKFFQHYNRGHQVDLINRYSKYTMKENIRYTAIKLLVGLHLAKFIKKVIGK